MKSVERLITLSRKITQNEDFSDSTGISNDEILQHYNDAQKRIESLINEEHPNVNLKEYTVNTAANVEAVAVPDDLFMETRIKLVEYNTTLAVNTNFYPLKMGSIQERIDGLSGEPSFYIFRGGEILLKPTPQSTGQVRFTYQFKRPELDVRRGAIETVTDTGTQVTALKLSETNTEAVLDTSGLNEDNYLSIVNRAGAVLMAGIEYDSIEADGTVNLTSAHTYDTGESIAVGNFVCRGLKHTHVCELADITERYLLAFANNEILKQDSNVDSAEASAKLIAMENDIVRAYGQPTSDVTYVPIIDSQYLDPEDEVF